MSDIIAETGDAALDKAIDYYCEKIGCSRSVAIVYLEHRLKQIATECFKSGRPKIDIDVFEECQ